MHDATRHVQGLRLSLGQDKAPLGLLLAAGCGMSVQVAGAPLIPGIAGMTEILTSMLCAEGSGERAAMAKLLACLQADQVADPTIEDWLTHVRALKLVAKGGPVRDLSMVELDALETAITGAIVGLVERDLPPGSTPFQAVASWAGAMERQYPVEIFTTNYDLLLEQAFEAMQGPFFDGFVGVREPFFDNASVSASAEVPLPARFTRIWKLHGSVNWYLTSDDQVTRSEQTNGRRRLIHPSHLKYDESRQMPYLALQDRLRRFIGQRGALLVTCGYSFADRHINSVLTEALQANPTASLIALLFGALSDYPAARKLAASHSNMALYGSDRAIVGTREGPWMADEKTATGLKENDAGGVDVLLGDFTTFGTLLAEMLDRSVSQR
jgi:hypothetical protein